MIIVNRGRRHATVGKTRIMQHGEARGNRRHEPEDLSRIRRTPITANGIRGDLPREGEALADKRCVTQGSQTLVADSTCP